MAHFIFVVKACKNKLSVIKDRLGPRVKGQLISKEIYGLLTSPKNELTNLFCLPFYSSRQTNKIHPSFFWENLQLANLLFGSI